MSSLKLLHNILSRIKPYLHKMVCWIHVYVFSLMYDRVVDDRHSTESTIKTKCRKPTVCTLWMWHGGVSWRNMNTLDSWSNNLFKLSEVSYLN